MKELGIIGAGAAGLMAAVSAASCGNAHITLIEKNTVCGKKIRITGKGRCNVTNCCSSSEMQEAIPCGAKFLFSALHSFSPQNTMEFFEENGIPLKTERGNRVFPVSDKAADIADTLARRALAADGVVLRRSSVRGIEKTQGGFRVLFEEGELLFDRLILATGGASYPLTGSTGDGYRFAAALGHTVSKLSPALVPLVAKEKYAAEMMGLSLKNVKIRVENENGKIVFSDFGEMLFTHFGVSGPIILSASAFLDFEKNRFYRLYIDLKPALTEEMLDKRLLSDFEENINRDFINSLSKLLPVKMIAPIVALSGIDARRKVNSVTKEERKSFCTLLKHFPLTLTGTRPLAEAIVTKGGAELKEINPKTMESKICKGLYFAGEMLNAHALTGGYNLQIAFSTGYLAGKSAATEE